jgi:hypothetical protein
MQRSAGQMTISLAFLAPNVVKAAVVEGRLPRGIGVERLRDAALPGDVTG